MIDDTDKSSGSGSVSQIHTRGDEPWSHPPGTATATNAGSSSLPSASALMQPPSDRLGATKVDYSQHWAVQTSGRRRSISVAPGEARAHIHDSSGYAAPIYTHEYGTGNIHKKIPANFRNPQQVVELTNTFFENNIDQLKVGAVLGVFDPALKRKTESIQSDILWPQ